MKIVEETDTRLVIRQPKSYYALVMGGIFIAVACWAVYVALFSATGQHLVFLIPAVVFLLLGGISIKTSNNMMEVTFDKSAGLITCTYAKPSFFPRFLLPKSVEINRTQTNLSDVASVARFTGTFGVVLKDGTQVQYGTGGMVPTERLFYMSKLSAFLGLPIREGVIQKLYPGKPKRQAMGVVISILVVIIAYILLTYLQGR